uniref:DUS-like FMN-binding domain-containing protein n=1 Tax=Salarias fasciatus TaxID=181472 RepID=A0A672JK63_SALFA
KVLKILTNVFKYNCDICFTPMIVAADFLRSIKARDSEFTTNQVNDRPLIVQFAAHDAQTLADAACVVAPYSYRVKAVKHLCFQYSII